LKRTLYKLVYRAGLTSEDAITVQWFFDQLRSNLTNYFSIGVWQFTLLLVASSLCIAVAFSLTRRLRLLGSFWPLASLALLSTVPPLVYLGLLPQHAYFHDFSILKFAMPMALTILTLAPASVALLIGRAAALHYRFSPRAAGTVFSTVACLAAISGIYFSMTRYAAPQQHFPPIRGGIGVLGTIIERNVEYADVVFSPQFEIGHMTAEAGFSRKLVHRSSDVDKDLPAVTRYVCTPFNLVVVSDGIDEPKRADPPSEIRRDSGLVFYRWRNLQPKPCAGNVPK
jgi:hypothetical protein